MNQKISLGRIVMITVDADTATKLAKLATVHHYTVGQKLPGLVVGAMENNSISAKLFPDGPNDLYLTGIPFSTGNQPGTWNWPDRIGAEEQAA